ncbi:MAG: hypothetical protein KAI64_05730, partial [Thermoplasmata archaeon]|nr:hypothetical protein [Thermoplasmata archaeon]
IIATGHWDIGGEGLMLYNSKMPAFSMILSSFSVILGIEPFMLVSILVPIITSTSVVAIYMLAFKITRNQLVSYFAGLFFALSGFYLYLTTAIMKETIGLSLMPIIFYLFIERRDPRKRVLAAIFLILLPFIHHLTALIMFTAIGFIVITENYIALKSKALNLRNVLLDVFLGPFLFLFTYMYYSQANIQQFDRVVNFEEGILFLSIFLIFAIFAAIVSKRKKARATFRSKAKKGSWLKILDPKFIVVLIGLGLLIANHFVKIFAGTLTTSTELLLLAIPYILLLFIGFSGFNIMRFTETKYRAFIISVLLGAITVISFGFLRGLDPFSLNLVYRSYDYIDVALAICLGIGMTYMIKSVAASKKGKRTLITKKSVVAVLGFLLILATLPLAYSGESMWSLRDMTEEREFKAMEFFGPLANNSTVGTDQRLADIADPYFGISASGTLPWLFHQATESGFEYLLIEDEWLDVGAQMYPFENAKIDEDEFTGLMENTDIVYVAGAPGRTVYILKVDG